MVSKLQKTKLTGIEEIPTGWEVRTLGELFDFSGGMPFSRSALGKQGVLYLHYGDIHKRNQNMFSTSDDFNWLPKIDIGIEDVKDYALLTTGDVVFADASEDYEGVGKSVVIVNDENKPFISGLHTIVAREKDQRKLLDIGYKRYFLTPKFVRDQFVKIATGATVFGISKTNIKQIKILVPPIPEQEEIATTLSSVDKAIQKTKSIIEQIEKMKKGLMQQLLTKGIGHTKFKKTEIGEIPEKWEVVKVGELCESIVPGRNKPKEFNGNIPWITTSDIDGPYITTSKSGNFVSREELERVGGKIIPPNSVIMTCVGTLGITTVVKTAITINQQLHAFVCPSSVNPLFLSKALELKESYMKKLATQTTIPYLNKSNCNSIPVPLPSLEEQNTISSILEMQDAKLNNELKKLESLTYLKQGLMQSLLTGKVRVKVNEVEMTRI